MAVLGIDGWKGAWVAALVTDGEVSWRHGRFAEVLGDQHGDDVRTVGVDIPIGLPERGPRGCDVAAKAVLGPAGSRVFALPVRAAYATEVESQADANVMLKSLGEPGVSAQAWGLRAAVHEVAGYAADPRIVEVHPELSFAAMAGHVLAAKRTARGVAQRLDALAGWVDGLAALRSAPDRIPVDDCLDALAAAWSAERVAAGTAVRYPAGEQALDRSGRPMVIYA